jgi:hypothetical protein
MTEPAAKAILGAADAAVTWWRSKKPRGWSARKHIENPLVNCSTYRERLLARRASIWFAHCKGYSVGKRGDANG